MYPTDMSVVTDRRWVLWGWLVSRVPAADMMTPMIMFLVVAARGILGGGGRGEGRFGKQIYRFFFFSPFSFHGEYDSICRHENYSSARSMR